MITLAFVPRWLFFENSTSTLWWTVSKASGSGIELIQNCVQLDGNGGTDLKALLN